MPWVHLVWLGVVWLGLALLMFDWRASLTVCMGVAINFVGIFALIPPVYVVDHVIGYAVFGALLGAFVCGGRNRKDVRRLPLLLAFEQAVLCVNGTMWSDMPGLAWVFALQIVGMPLAMLGVIVGAQRLIEANENARRARQR